MPYNTTAIPPRKEVTGQTQLPLSRVKKIIAQDQDINICSNNAAFVITLATEMFVQHLAKECLTQAKLERKPRRNIQYKDVASAIQSNEQLEFLVDVAPKTIKYKDIKATAAAKRAQLRSGAAAEGVEESQPVTNGKKHKSSAARSSLNGSANIAGLLGNNGAKAQGEDEGAVDPSSQLEAEMAHARADDDDVDMTG